MATRLNKQEREYRESAVVDPKQKPKSNKLILVIVSAVLLLGAGAGGAAWYFRQIQDGATPMKEAARIRQPGYIYRQSAARAQRAAPSDQSDLEG